MGYEIPTNIPLSQTQAEVTAKIGAMRNLLSIDNVLKRLNVEKGESISVYDYLIKLLQALGVDPDLIINSFMRRFFETNFLAEKILKAMAQAFAALEKSVNPNVSIQNYLVAQPGGGLGLDESGKKAVTKSNYEYLIGSSNITTPLNSSIDALKMTIVKELTALTFGTSSSTASTLYPNADRREMLNGAAACGSAVFSMSSSAPERNQDLEYNRVQLLERINKGEPIVQATCQGVDITLPEDPSYLFGEGDNIAIGGAIETPIQSLDLIVNYTGSQVQQKNNQRNATSAAKNMRKQMLEKLIANSMELLKPIIFGTSSPLTTIPGTTGVWNGIIDALNNEPNASEQLVLDDFMPPDPCGMLTTFGFGPIDFDENTTEARWATIVKIFCNVMLNAAISFFLIYVIKQLKRFIAEYMAKKNYEKLKRRINKNKIKFNLLTKYAAETAQNAARLSALSTDIGKVISGEEEMTFF